MRPVHAFSAIAILALAGCAARVEAPAPLATVPSVDFARYAGTWHEIARYPNGFQQDCASDTTATYSPIDTRRIAVLNRCRRADGSEMTASGVAEVVDAASNARLKVSFLPGWLRWTGIGRGDYWIIHLAPDYSVALIGEPSRTYLWLLARAPALGDEVLRSMLPRMRAAGYDPDRLLRASPRRSS